MKLVADAMLGRLALWLRVLGRDTVFSASMRAPDFLNWVNRGRTGLTRRTALRDHPHVIFIESDHPREQLVQAVADLGLGPPWRGLFTRCLRCNRELTPLDRAEVFGRVPEYVYQTQEFYSQCPACGRVFWAGTHVSRMARLLEGLGLADS
jgi:uncharacterized protein with PIN domain